MINSEDFMATPAADIVKTLSNLPTSKFRKVNLLMDSKMKRFIEELF